MVCCIPPTHHHHLKEDEDEEEQIEKIDERKTFSFYCPVPFSLSKLWQCESERILKQATISNSQGATSLFCFTPRNTSISFFSIWEISKNFQCLCYQPRSISLDLDVQLPRKTYEPKRPPSYKEMKLICPSAHLELTHKFTQMWDDQFTNLVWRISTYRWYWFVIKHS